MIGVSRLRMIRYFAILDDSDIVDGSDIEDGIYVFNCRLIGCSDTHRGAGANSCKLWIITMFHG